MVYLFFIELSPQGLGNPLLLLLLLRLVILIFVPCLLALSVLSVPKFHFVFCACSKKSKTVSINTFIASPKKPKKLEISAQFHTRI